MIWLASLAVASDCADRPALLARAEEDVVNGFLSDAQRGLDDVVAALGCADPVSAEVHRRYWQAQGVAWSYADDERFAVALQSSRRMEAVWAADIYGDVGPEVDAWNEPPDASSPVTVTLTHLADDDQVWLDGQEVEPLLEVAPGAYLLQVGPPAGTRFATALLVDEPLTVRIPLAAPASAPEVVLETPPGPSPDPAPAASAEPLEDVPVVADALVVEDTLDVLPVASRRVTVELPDLQGGSVCAREADSRDCEPLDPDGRMRLETKDGLVPVEIEWQRGGDRQLFTRWYWVDQRPPTPGDVHVVPRPDGVEVVASGFRDRESWIAGYRVATDSTCDNVLLARSGTDPRLQIDLNVPGERLFVCAVDAAGNVSAGRVAKVPKGVLAAAGRTAVHERLQFVSEPDVGHGRDDGTACTSSKPRCKGKWKDANGSVLLADTDAPQTLWTSSRGADGETVDSLRTFVHETRPPDLGTLDFVVYGSQRILFWRDFLDAGAGIEEYLVGQGSYVPASCRPLIETPRSESYIRLEGRTVHAWVCAVDRLGNTTDPVSIRLR